MFCWTPFERALVYGREAIRDARRPMLGVSLLTFAPETIVVTVSDDGKYVVVWIKEDGAWKIFADIFNSVMRLE